MAATDTPREKSVHHGRNIRRLREVKGIKQEILAQKLGREWNQVKVSQLEATEEIGAEVLSAVAKALEVAPEWIERLTEESVNQYFNTFNGENYHAYAYAAHPVNCTFHQAEKHIMEVVEKNEKLYQELLKVEREKIALLERLLEKK